MGSVCAARAIVAHTLIHASTHVKTVALEDGRSARLAAEAALIDAIDSADDVAVLCHKSTHAADDIVGRMIPIRLALGF